jgi:hypothetical protein
MSSFTNALWISLLGILVTVGTPIFHRWYSSEKIAFVSTHTSINKPTEAVWANRHFNYSQPDFVQTWDFIIVDAQATNSFAITYGTHIIYSKVRMNSLCSFSWFCFFFFFADSQVSGTSTIRHSSRFDVCLPVPALMLNCLSRLAKSNLPLTPTSILV